MSIVVLNEAKVTELLKEKGLTRQFVGGKLGLKGSLGYGFLKGDWMPKNSARKARLLAELADILGVEVPQILLRLEAKTA